MNMSSNVSHLLLSKVAAFAIQEMKCMSVCMQPTNTFSLLIMVLFTENVYHAGPSQWA